MRVKFSHLLPCLLLAMMTWATAAFAQDDMPGPATNHFNTNDPQVYDEKPLLLENDGRQLKNSAQRDSLDINRTTIVAPAAKQKAGSDPKKNKEEDPLNFNFLYYIIRNFKASDLMME
jgi:hypothetical protein